MEEPGLWQTRSEPSAANPKKRAWILQLTAQERSTLFATFGGWALDGMDVMVYTFVIATLMASWRMSSGQAGLLAAGSLLISAVGGWLAGLLADRFGRVRVLQITIAWFAFFTFLSGFTNSFWQLMLTRSLQGLGFGGEWAVGSVLMGETIHAQDRGKAVGFVQGGWAVGWGVAAVFYVICFSLLPASMAWRAMFWIGILPAFLVFYVRRHVPEPEVYSKAHEKLAAQGGRNQFLGIFSPSLARVTFLTSLMAIGAQGGYYAITTWLPTYLKAVRGLSVLNTSAYLIVVILGSLAGYMASAYLTDRLGRKRTLTLFAACSFLTVAAYTFLPLPNRMMLVIGFPLGFFSSGSFGPMGAFLTELFPTQLRGSGQGFSYNAGRGIGALFPPLVGYLSARIPLGYAIALFSLSAYFLMIVSVSFLPETRGRELKV